MTVARSIVFGFAAVLLVAFGPPVAPAAHAASADAKRLQKLIDAPQRSTAIRTRVRYRNPAPVLDFFKIGPRARVIEILPGSAGYWTEILAPYLRDRGRYAAAIPRDNPARPELTQAIAATKANLAADPARYSRVAVIPFSADLPDLGAPGRTDFVLTFRNLHNWMAAGRAEPVLAAFHRALRPGGVLGIEEHRARADQPQDPAAKSGYVREDYAIALIEKAGFRFAGKSEINANPRDTKDYADGVWTLPPVYRLKDQDREKYTAIGESDRFVMKFVKR